MFESIPTYPDAGRYWRMVDDLGVNIFYTAPTAIRAIARAGDEWVKRYLAQEPAHPGHGRRADQPRGLALVPRRGGRGALRGRRHLVADRDRRHPDHAAAGRHARRSPARPRCPSSASSRCWSTTHGTELDGQRRRRQPLPARHLARPGAHHLRRPPALPRDLLLALPRPLLHRRRLPPRRGRLLLDHRPGRRRAQRLRPPAGHGRDRERAGRARRGRRGGGRRLPARDQGHRHLRLRLRHPRVRDLGPGGARRRPQGAGAPRDRRRSLPRTGSRSSRVCPRPARARSCGASCARSRPASTRSWET